MKNSVVVVPLGDLSFCARHTLGIILRPPKRQRHHRFPRTPHNSDLACTSTTTGTTEDNLRGARIIRPPYTNTHTHAYLYIHKHKHTGTRSSFHAQRNIHSEHLTQFLLSKFRHHPVLIYITIFDVWLPRDTEYITASVRHKESQSQSSGVEVR